MSSAKALRKFVHRRIHKERAQPEHRAKLGLLEKHKDYVQRAKAFHSKEERLRVLQEKAALRNPDEFYYGMVNAKTNEKGVHVIEKKKQVTHEVMKKMKLEDHNYLNLKAVEETKKIEKLQSSLHFGKPINASGVAAAAASSKNHHTLFLDDDEQVKNFDAVEHFGTVPELANQQFNRIRRSTLETAKIVGTTDPIALKLVKKQKDRSYKELNARMKRKNELDKLTQRLQVQRNMMGKGTVRKIKGDENSNEPPQYVWKAERKK